MISTFTFVAKIWKLKEMVNLENTDPLSTRSKLHPLIIWSDIDNTSSLRYLYTPSLFGILPISQLSKLPEKNDKWTIFIFYMIHYESHQYKILINNFLLKCTLFVWVTNIDTNLARWTHTRTSLDWCRGSALAFSPAAAPQQSAARTLGLTAQRQD